MYCFRLMIIFSLPRYSVLLLGWELGLVSRGTVIASDVETIDVALAVGSYGYFMYGAFAGYGCIWCAKGGNFKSTSLVFCI